MKVECYKEVFSRGKTVASQEMFNEANITYQMFIHHAIYFYLFLLIECPKSVFNTKKYIYIFSYI